MLRSVNRRRRMRIGIACLCLFWTFLAPSPGAAPAFLPESLAAIDDAISQAITDARTPGAVLHLEREGAVYQKAYGDRAILPEREAMTVDTIFDAASLTKVIATTPAVMKLVEEGKLDPEAPVSRYLPAFTGAGKEAITVRQLLTHTSGLRAGMVLRGRTALEAACAEPLPDPPGKTYRYSDINFILLGCLVEQVSGERLDAYCQRTIYQPLGMKDTGFRPFDPAHPPAPPTDPRIAPTEKQADGVILRGIVHDSTARRMGGVAGHAGLFLTATDLARFGRMMLAGGELDGVRIFQPATVRRMTTVQTPPGLPRRGFGWDIDSPFAGPRGELFPIGSYGHTGWTGTRIWIDPFSQTLVILLTNRNHPDEEGSVLALQRQIGTLAARAIRDFDFHEVPGALPAEPAPPSTKPAPAGVPQPEVPILTGIDVLKRDHFRQLRGRRIGLITNATGMDREWNATIDLLHAAPGLKLVALFSPEHGIRGDLDHDGIGDSVDEKTGLPVYSLYGERRAPGAAQLAGVDTLVFDIQDIGCRFYTYISTMANCLEAAGQAKIRFVVLDRPNPIGRSIEGPVASGPRSFTAAHPIPIRHGLTVGELARLINAERGFGADLGVIRCEGGPRPRWFDQTGQPWRNPSPNMRNPTAALLYPGVGLLEFCKVSVGRGTDSPFEILGAPYFEEIPLAAELNRAGLPGLRCVPLRFTPASSVYAGVECRGIRFLVTDRDAFRPVDLGITLATILQRRYGDRFELGQMSRLLSDEPTLKALREGRSPADIEAGWKDAQLGFFKRCQPYRLYAAPASEADPASTR